MNQRLSQEFGSSGRTVWTLPGVEFDEGRWSLTVDGVPVEIERKPLELFLELLHREGDVVTKTELFDSVWAGVTVVESSLPTAIAKLRRALGPHTDLIETVARLGYRLTGKAKVERRGAVAGSGFGFEAGAAVPRRPGWIFVRRLSRESSDAVWLVEQADGGARLVFKFAQTPGQLRSLKRETALAQLLAQSHGEAGAGSDRFLGVVEHDFSTIPAFAAFPFGGVALDEWMAADGADSARDARLSIIVSAARMLAAAHRLGVLHNDIKPANILIASEEGGQLIARLVDFGSGALATGGDRALALLSGMTLTPDDERAVTSAVLGSPGYLAPEVAAGAPASIASDIYALGLAAFRLLVGDIGAPMAPGWERLVPDPLLREDIAEACALDPTERFASADQFADRVESLEQRRQAARAESERRIEVAELQRLQLRAEARRPWVRTAIAVLVVGLGSTAALAWQSQRQRDEAIRQEQIASSMSAFLTDDLLARSDPAKAEAADETISEAALRASAEIETRFRAAPLIAGRLHHSLARAFDQRSDLDAAREEYRLAENAFARAGSEAAPERARVLVQWGQLEALSGDAARLPQARRLIDRGKAIPFGEDAETPVWVASAEGSYALAAEDVSAAQKAFVRAAELGDALPDLFTERQRLNLRQRVAFTYLRLGDGARAEQLLAPLAAGLERLEGPDHPDTLNIRLNRVQALLVAGRNAQVVTAATALLPRMEARFGRDHRRTLQVLAVRQQALGALERYAEAARDGERVWRTTAEHEGPAAFQAVAGRADTGETQCRAGDTEAGLANARAALDTLAATGQGDTALQMGVRVIFAGCLVAAGRAREAAPYLAQIDRAKVSALVGDAHWGANVDLLLGYVSLARGARADAAAFARKALEGFDPNSVDAYRQRMLDRLTRAARGPSV